MEKYKSVDFMHKVIWDESGSMCYLHHDHEVLQFQKTRFRMGSSLGQCANGLIYCSGAAGFFR